jgi:hypothetical protein
MIVERPADELCREASRLGTLLVAEIGGSPTEIESELSRLARWPAVVLAIVSPEAPLKSNVRLNARNLPLAQVFGPGSTVAPAEWADLVICQGDDAIEISRQAHRCRLPVIARRAAGWRDDLTRARRECDRLQGDLAGLGEFAGFLV